ncbi:L-type lectin-domain containing receptor kinase S.1-like [Cryptomeria japonica]|uniref:L-type lectin-domain containing receptor kinase S.1-like n=1 Tax=Cryptomeria japonica TaxID=3369 RepID=UPI0027DA2C7C|nr:L-type lectin-domain containing receptor kinase S.1-like [Cryptomeria japonica]
MDGIIIAGMVAITLLIIGFIYFKGIGQEKKEQKEGDTNNVESMDLDGGEHRITYEAIMKAIEEFRNSYLFGSDSFGKVYKAILVNEGGRRENNMVVAVKFSNLLEDGKSVSRSPSHEIEALKFVHHRNIVYLLGWMRVPNMKLEIFVYEYMPKASLWEALNLAAVPVGNSELEKLNWKNHYNIVLGVAQGLKYSHHDWRPPIIHGDIKSANILLNNEYIAHVSDFGLAKVMNSEGPSTSSSVFVGSSGYMAPDTPPVDNTDSQPATEIMETPLEDTNPESKILYTMNVDTQEENVVVDRETTEDKTIDVTNESLAPEVEINIEKHTEQSIGDTTEKPVETTEKPFEELAKKSSEVPFETQIEKPEPA